MTSVSLNAGEQTLVNGVQQNDTDLTTEMLNMPSDLAAGPMLSKSLLCNKIVIDASSKTGLAQLSKKLAESVIAGSR